MDAQPQNKKESTPSTSHHIITEKICVRGTIQQEFMPVLFVYELRGRFHIKNKRNFKNFNDKP